MSQNGMRQKIGISVGLLLLLCLATACSLTQSPFATTTGNAGSAFAAAATTLAYAHEGKVTSGYAASSFAAFQSELNGTDQTLAAQSGVDRHTVQHLLSLYAPAMHVIDAPCLSNNCDWRQQVELLQRASEAFLKASGS